MKNLLMNLISVFLLVIVLATPSLADEANWLWPVPQAREESRHLTLTVLPMDKSDTPNIAQFHCDITSDFNLPGATVKLDILDAKGQLVSEGNLPLDISAGATVCTISLDTRELPLGSYDATFHIAHDSLLTEPSHAYILRNVNAADLKSQLDLNGARNAELTAALDAMETDTKSYPYLRLKTNLVADILEKARKNAELGAWESLESQLRFIDRRLNAVHAGIVFGASATERNDALTPARLNDLLIQDGAFIAGTRPVFLFGSAISSPDVEEIARLSRFQLNATSITVAPDNNPAADHSPEALKSRLDPFFDAAATQNVSVAVQLSPLAIATSTPEAAPALMPDDTGLIATDEIKRQWNSYLSLVGPFFENRAMLVGVSLAKQPRFRFSGEAVKAGFLEFLRANYEDRLVLNRAWRSHLATLEDIELWGEGDYATYQEHRPYKFDWQSYHQQLGNEYFQWSRTTARSHLAGLPLMVTLNNASFEPGEAIYGVDREVLSGIMDISACTGVSRVKDPIYALAHPHESANYALLRSLAPDQPVFNVSNTWELPDQAAEEDTYRFVHATLWENVMAGMSGSMVPADSLLFQRPEALEAFATAAIDINRLAPIVLAFQNAPADVGILYSQSSRVFDGGEPHLSSALSAYEGTSFGGYHVEFITESQCSNGILDTLKILVIPDTPAVSDSTFKKISQYVDAGGTVARTGAPIPYNERGFSRDDLIRNTARTVLVRGLNLPTEYLHAMDAASVLGTLPQIPRAVTPQGYPIEGVRTRYIEYNGEQYLYIVNLRKEATNCLLAGAAQSGRDLIQGQNITFPTTLNPLVPMLIRLTPVPLEMTVTAAATEPNP